MPGVLFNSASCGFAGRAALTEVGGLKLNEVKCLASMLAVQYVVSSNLEELVALRTTLLHDLVSAADSEVLVLVLALSQN